MGSKGCIDVSRKLRLIRCTPVGLNISAIGCGRFEPSFRFCSFWIRVIVVGFIVLRVSVSVVGSPLMKMPIGRIAIHFSDMLDINNCVYMCVFNESNLMNVQCCGELEKATSKRRRSSRLILCSPIKCPLVWQLLDHITTQLSHRRRQSV